MESPVAEQGDPMAEVGVILAAASQRVTESITVAKELLAAGFAGPALVWAVRSVEIFIKEFLVAPVYFDGSGSEGWFKALKRANRDFGSSNWKKAMAIVQAEYGPLDPLLTEDGADAYQAWEKTLVRTRGAVVHGELVDVPRELAEQAIEYGEQLVQQLKLRMLSGSRHPLSGIFRGAIEAAQQALRTRGERPAF
jgi:hypothetical protein